MEDCTRMPDSELLRSLKALARDERRNLPRILGRLAEMDRRDLAIERGFTSLFDYCRRELRWSESETARRIHVARAARRYNVLYPMLASGRLTLTTASLLAPRLRPENHRDLIKRALGRSLREVEALVASIAPRPEKPDSIRPLGPARAASGADTAGLTGPLFAGAVAPAPPPVAVAPAPPPGAQPSCAAPPTPAPPSRVEFTFTAEEVLARDVERARELLRHKHPRCRLEDVFREAVRALLDRIDPERRLERKARRADLGPAAAHGGRESRRIPRAVRDAVWRRDGGACAFVGAGGRRCGSRSRLEYDHVRPWALGGTSGDPANVRLLCRAHNLLLARRRFGPAVDAAIARRRPPAPA